MTDFQKFAIKIKSLVKNKQFRSVIDFAEKSNKTYLDDPNIAYLLAFSYYNINDFENSLFYCENAFITNVDNEAFVGLYGSVLRNTGRLGRSIEMMEDFIQRHRSNGIVVNNLANAYIDAGKIIDAQNLLDGIDISTVVNSDDIILNRSRIDNLLSVIGTEEMSHKSDETEDNDNEDDAFASEKNKALVFDPLLRAFEAIDQEGSAVKALIRNNKDDGLDKAFEKSSVPERNLISEAEEIIQLAKHQCTISPKETIRDLNSLLRKGFFSKNIYEIASQAFISLKLFADAETSGLTAVALGSKDKSLYINLSSLAALRGDLRLASHWHSILKAEFPIDNSIKAVTKMLKEKIDSIANENHDYFQVNLEQASIGSFV